MGASLALVQLVVRAVVPVAGVLFFGWAAGNVLFVHCADVLAGLYVVCVLACARLVAFDDGGGPAWWRRLWSGTQLALTALLPFGAAAIPIVGTMLIVLAQAGFDWRGALADRGLWLGVGAQFAAAVGLLLRVGDAVPADPRADWVIRRWAGLVFLRWGLVALAAWSVIGMLPGRGLLLVVAGVLTQLALDLRPNAVLRTFGAADLAEPPPSGSAALPPGGPTAPRAVLPHGRPPTAARRRLHRRGRHT
jgi:hypothetical protein